MLTLSAGSSAGQGDERSKGMVEGGRHATTLDSLATHIKATGQPRPSQTPVARLTDNERPADS